MRLLNTIHPSETQKQVIALILAAANPTIAGDDISKTPNLVAARNMLAKLGVINFDMGNAELTDDGAALAVEQNIADESGQLTADGTALIGKNNQQDVPDGTSTGTDMPDDLPIGESFVLLKSLLKIV